MAENELQHIHSLLLDLQDVLREKFTLENEIEALPVNLKALQEELAKANIKYLELTDKYNKAKEDVTSNSIKYDDAFAARANAEKKMDTITTQREYEALSKEIDEAKVRENGLLKARSASQAAVEELNNQLKAQEDVTDALQKQVDDESAKIDQTISEMQAQIREIDEKCAAIKAQGISDDLYEKFAKIVKNKKGIGIVPIHGLVCQGCHMILPQQFVNDVRSDNSTEYCPYCSRILYYEESEDMLDFTTDFSEGSEEDESLADIVDEDSFDL